MYIRAQTDDCKEVANLMLGIMRGQPITDPSLAKKRRYPSIRDRMQAADWLTNRAFGLPREFVEITEGAEARAQRQTLIAAMSPEDREALMALLRRAIEAQAPPALPSAPEAPDGPHA